MHPEDFINLDKQLLNRLSAVVTRGDESLRKYSPEQRGCYFEGERELQFFKTYTKTQCNFECLTNYTIRECGCVHFSYPRNQSTDICDLNRVQCQNKAYSSWPENDEMSKNSVLPCNCLPPCNNIEYKIKSKQIFDMLQNSSMMLAKVEG